MTPASRSTHRLTTSLIVIVGIVVAGLAILPQIGRAQTATTYPVVDTGQTQCYDATTEISCPAEGEAFYGQDAQFTGNTPSFIDNGDGAISDAVTGLVWQQSPDTNGDGSILAADKLSYAAATTYCENLTLAGYTDWRLPSIKALYSLIDFRGTDPSGYSGTDTSGLTPFIDTTAFQFAYGDTSAGERLIDSQYASSNVYVANTVNDGGQTIFGVNFADGRIKGYGSIMPGNRTKTFFVQCVRGNIGYGVNDFVDNGNQTITDNASNLMWTQSDSGTAMNWQEALAWVQTKNAANYLGHSDWRLPDAKELQSILDYSRSPDTTNSAAINVIFSATSFTNEGGQTDWPWYWASTTHANYSGVGGGGVYVAFGRAGGWQKASPSATCYTLYDVHGAGAQRSDPKTSSSLVTLGTACSGGTAYGNGPQGDIQRAANYVRLVRDAETITATPTATATAIGTATPTPTATATATSIATPTSTPVAYPLVETGQITCYDADGAAITCPAEGAAFYGQDAQFTGNAFSYTNNGNGAITDNVTGLVWQQTPSSASLSWQQAVDTCDALTLAGQSNWRTPSLKELFSISDFSQGWPYLNTTYFDLAGAIVNRDEQYWSSNYYAGVTVEGGSNAAFGVNHGTGHIKAYPASVTGPMGKHVRCVRGDTYGVNDLTDNGDGTITDQATGLMWSQTDSGSGLDWEHALAYAQTQNAANYLGHSDWRLPNVKELQSIVDYTRAPGATNPANEGPAIDLMFATTGITNEAGVADYPYYWTSTSALFQAGRPYYYAWYVAFGRAVNAQGLDFHGAGAVRFDTKVEGGPAGEGGERYYNYVRLVRDADDSGTVVTQPYRTYLPLLVK